MNLFQAITSALDNALAKDPTAGMLYLLACFAFHQLHFVFVHNSECVSHCLYALYYVIFYILILKKA